MQREIESKYEEIRHPKWMRRIASARNGDIWLYLRSRDQKPLIQKSFLQKWEMASGSVAQYPLEVILLVCILPRCPQILPLESWSYGPDYDLLLAYPYCRGGDLEQLGTWMMDSGMRVTETFVWNVFVQIADALAMLREFCGFSSF